VNKKIILDKRAEKEINKFPKAVRISIKAYTDILEKTGELRKPFAKKINSKPNLYEIRVRCQGTWRVFYAYVRKKEIIILSALHKKTQKTPSNEIKKAIRRLNEYL